MTNEFPELVRSGKRNASALHHKGPFYDASMANLEVDVFEPWLHPCRIAKNVLLVNGVFVGL